MKNVRIYSKSVAEELGISTTENTVIAVFVDSNGLLAYVTFDQVTREFELAGNLGKFSYGTYEKSRVSDSLKSVVLPEDIRNHHVYELNAIFEIKSHTKNKASNRLNE